MEFCWFLRLVTFVTACGFLIDFLGVMFACTVK